MCAEPGIPSLPYPIDERRFLAYPIPMGYRILADVVVVAHLSFVAFAAAGAWLVWRRPRLAWLHVPAVLWAVAVEWAGWICPLTPLENRLRTLAGGGAYKGDFVVRYLLPLLYPADLPRRVQLALGAAVLALNLCFYGLWLCRRLRRPARPEGSRIPPCP